MICTKHLTVGIFHDDTITRELGKKGTESDIAMFNRKMGDQILTIMSPVGDKLAPKSQIISSIDTAVVAFTGMTRELGETIVMLDSIGVSTGIAVTSPYATHDQIIPITKDTSLKSFTITDRDIPKILQILSGFDPTRDSDSAPVIVVDHSFSVKGVGEVILGFLRKGRVKKYDKLTLLPANKEVIVRSIQVQDEDQEQAEPGTRVGLALKGANVEEMRRGSVLSSDTNVKTATTLSLHFTKSPFYSDELKDGVFHVTVGMQTILVNVSWLEKDSIVVNSEKPIIYMENDTFILLDLNAKKTRVVGKAHQSS